jgi:hypothetical protein
MDPWQLLDHSELCSNSWSQLHTSTQCSSLNFRQQVPPKLPKSPTRVYFLLYFMNSNRKKKNDTHGGALCHHHRTTQEDNGGRDQRIAGRQGSGPGRGQNSQYPKDQVVSWRFVSPVVSIKRCTTLGQSNALRGREHGRCSRAVVSSLVQVYKSSNLARLGSND